MTKMDLKITIVVLGILISELALISHGSIVFPVHHKFKDQPSSFNAMRAHDAARHQRRALTAADFGLGGLLEKNWLYYTKLRIGTPPVEYNLQIDTGSSIPWLVCHTNRNCPTKTEDGLQIKMYNPKNSSTSRLQRCGKKHCVDTTNYGDGSKFFGFFVWDVLKFGRVTKDFHTVQTSTPVRFGCGSKVSGEHVPPASIGILGLSQETDSLVSQLADRGLTKAAFAHCLDRSRGGGIFTIGEVVEPKVKTTPLVEDSSHYVVYMNGFMVGGQYVDIPSLKVGKGRQVVLDSGASSSVLPKEFYDPIIKKIFAQQPQLKFENNTVLTNSYCFSGFTGHVDDVFPTISFQFEGGLTLTVPAHDYILPQLENTWCISYTMTEAALVGPDSEGLIIIGDEAFTNKFVVYDLDDQTVGWTKYDCTSSIKVRDRISGAVYSVGAHNLGH